jgi:DNA gyrase subunit B
MLASDTIGTLITSLGCGIGREEYNPDKIRYHHIIIMTDADVDGSHIRTLLLTFFYRQMPELIERGHIYIAQPPLYKVKKGKQEQYLKDDIALNTYLLQLALENTSLHVSPNSPALSDIALEQIIQQCNAGLAAIEKLSKHYPRAVLNSILDLPRLKAENMRDKAAMSEWVEKMLRNINKSKTGNAGNLSVSLKEGIDKQVFIPVISIFENGINTEYSLNPLFFSSTDYAAILQVKLSDVLLADQLFTTLMGDQVAPRRDFIETYALDVINLDV